MCTLVVGAFLSGCAPGSALREAMRPSSPYERYAKSLRDAGLHETALGRDWLAAGDEVLAHATPTDLPLRETGYLSPAEPAARAWQFGLAQGRRLVVDVETLAADPLQVYLDLFEQRGDPPVLHRVANAEQDAARLEFEPELDGTFILRLQPELLRGGRFTLTETTTATLMFPIEGREGHGITGSFGDPREGGRAHEGIDIFAPRGTRVVAAAEGRVSSVGTNNLGGNVVWIRTSNGHAHYYAHLDTQLVGVGTHVHAGEAIGTVGNTGNARTTAPHLHFGVYRRGSGVVDPFPFIYTGTATPAPVTADIDALGSWRRVSADMTRLRAAPALTAPIVRDLPQHTVVRIDGAVRDWYRVQLPDGTSGFVSGRLTESTSQPVRTAQAPAMPLLDRPMATAAPVVDLEARPLRVLGRFGDFLFVRTMDGREGWIQL